ncbi:MAG: hypothetical protein IH845_01210 [Nanoarchaeota archaeon]|nr:hypothetical protein [Nanoarchaeota archaeon]
MTILYNREDIETSASAGDLMLIWSKQVNERWGSPFIGIFNQIQHYTGTRIFIRFEDPTIFLRRPVDIDGVSTPSAYPRIGDSLPSSQFRVGFLGIGEIVSELAKHRELRIHGDWISKLQRPYSIPKIRTITTKYLDIKNP